MKSEERQWTDAQLRAITTHGHDLLVAAAAGSGKTAVLVERIIRMITDPDQQVNLDDLLIVTFTKAAAAEMRERIGQALDRRLEEEETNLFLRRQQSLLGKAPIMTLHAFCMAVIRQYYYFLDLDPGFRLLDETEAALLREETLERVLEDRYAADDPEFYLLVDRYSNDRSDDALGRLILGIYEFSLSHPWPDRWLDEMAAAYRIGDRQTLDGFPWVDDLKSVLSRTLATAVDTLHHALELCAETGGPADYMPALTDDLQQLERAQALCGAEWETIRMTVCSISFGKLKAIRDKHVDAALKEQVKKMRDQVKAAVVDLQQQWFSRTSEEALADIRDMAPSVALITDLVRAFTEAFKKEKRRRGVLDFSDLEHECLAILRAKGSAPGDERPSVVAEQFRARFHEVMIDEYQDTNRVQEAIIQLITKKGSEGGNLFMVGDVKQSIYGFRLAEPGLFIEKYKQFTRPESTGEVIDLSSNFRSRSEIIDGANFLFRQTMDERVGGVAYDEAAALKFAASYPQAERPVDIEIIDRSDAEDGSEMADDADNAELEAAAIGDRIQAMLGDGSSPAYQVYDRALGQMRPIRFRDMAILLRSAGTSASMIKEALTNRGIPAYAELSGGYFDTVEVTVMLAVLQVIDNPDQDIPLAAVLRSPLVGFDADALAAIRMADRHVGYYRALKRFVHSGSGTIADKAAFFLKQINEWRQFSRVHSVAELIWQIYRDSGYYDYVGGLAGGTQRQANLQAFYDRARQYEQTTFRGLFRFLRFITRMRANGGDLGEARALSEQEDVVRIMTVHKSKGLEFPLVFVAGMGKRFNLRDTSASALLHNDLGFGTKWINPDLRASVPTLPYLAVRERLKVDAVAEELRILYVAVTRAREKLVLIGTIKDARRQIEKYRPALHLRHELLPEAMRAAAMNFLDWLLPSVLRHRSADVLHQLLADRPDASPLAADPSAWTVQLIHASALSLTEEKRPNADRERWERIARGKAVPAHSGIQDEVTARLEWQYAHAAATASMAKQTVTELKMQQDYFSAGTDDRLLAAPESLTAVGKDRPQFLQQNNLSAAERGTAMHLLMQHLDTARITRIEQIREQGLVLVAKEVITDVQEQSIDYDAVHHFFNTAIGRKMLHAKKVIRECPFSLALATDEVYPSWQGAEDQEAVLVQGVIDCIIEDPDGLILLDYKTDHFLDKTRAADELKRRYQMQLNLYRKAIERIWKKKVAQVALYSFAIGEVIDLTERGER